VTADPAAESPGRFAAWQRRADQFAAWVHREGRFPSESDDADGPRLARWLYVQRYAARGGSNVIWTPARAAYLERAVPGWCTVRAPHRAQGRRDDTDVHFERWTANAQALATFRRAHGRWPTRNDTGHGPKLAQWLQTQRRAARGLAAEARWTPERAAILDELAPGWLDTMNPMTGGFQPDDARWHARVQEVVAFVAEHGRLPNRERDGSLGIWLRNQRGVRLGHTSGHWSPERESVLDRLVPNWRQDEAAAA